MSTTTGPKEFGMTRRGSDTFLGESVYVNVDCGVVRITTKSSDVAPAASRIYLSPGVFEALVRHVGKAWKGTTEATQ